MIQLQSRIRTWALKMTRCESDLDILLIIDTSSVIFLSYLRWRIHVNVCPIFGNRIIVFGLEYIKIFGGLLLTL